MKLLTKNTFIIALLMFALNAFADATPSAREAMNIAKEYANDTAFSNILDESSSVQVSAEGENESQYIFEATATNPGMPSCSVEIKVSKETGMAFQDQIEACQNL